MPLETLIAETPGGLLRLNCSIDDARLLADTFLIAAILEKHGHDDAGPELLRDLARYTAAARTADVEPPGFTA